MSTLLTMSLLGWILLAILIAFLIWLLNKLLSQPTPPGAALPPPPPYSPPGTKGKASGMGASLIHLGRWVSPSPVNQSRGTEEEYTFLREEDNPLAAITPTTKPKAGIIIAFRLEYPSEEKCTIIDVTPGQTIASIASAGLTGSDGKIKIKVEIENREEGKPFKMKIVAEEYEKGITGYSMKRGGSHTVNVD